MLGTGKAFKLKKLQCIPDCHSGNAKVVHQLRFGRKPVTLAQASVPYRRPQLVGDLPEHGPVAGLIHGQTVEHGAHEGVPPPSCFSRPDV